MKTIQNYFHSHSLRFRIYLLLLLLIFLFGTLVAYNNFSAFSLLRKNVYRNTEDTLILYQKHLEDTLDRTETCLYTLAINNSALFTLKNTPQNTTEWFRALSQLQSDLRNAMSIYTANGFFCYLSAKEQLITQNFLADSLSLRQVIRQTVTQEAPNLSSWTVVETEGIYYLFRILYIDNAYMGAWVSLDTLLNSLTGDEDRARLVFSGEDGSLYCSGQPACTITPPGQQKESPYARELVNGEEMFALSRGLENGDCCLTLLVPYSDIANANTSLRTVHFRLAQPARSLLTKRPDLYNIRTYLKNHSRHLPESISTCAVGALCPPGCPWLHRKRKIHSKK